MQRTSKERLQIWKEKRERKEAKKQTGIIKQPNKRPAKKQRESIRNLKANGFRQVKPYPDLYLNPYGKIYSQSVGNYLKPMENRFILYREKRLSLARLILFVFKGEPIRERSHIIYINGSNLDLRPENIQYARKYSNGLKNEINAENLRTAIRCYFEVEKRYKVQNYMWTRLYLTTIMSYERPFYVKYQEKAGLKIFQSYMEGLTNSHARTAKKHGISVHDCRYIVNGFINLLINDILTDLQAGKLTVKEYFKPKTKTQEIREANEYLIKHGHKPLPLRKKSVKEKYREFKKRIDDFAKSCSTSENENEYLTKNGHKPLRLRKKDVLKKWEEMKRQINELVENELSESCNLLENGTDTVFK